MIVKNENGRRIEVSVCGKYSDDIQIESASYLDSDEEVSEQDIDFIMNNCGDRLFEAYLDKRSGRFERD